LKITTIERTGLERKGRPGISAVIPAFNEEKTIGDIVLRALDHVDEVVVVDDGSSDDTSSIAEGAGAQVVRNELNRGILAALREGFEVVEGEIVVTLDADGQHDPGEIPLLLEPILQDEADLVIGCRRILPYLSERVITALTRLKVNVHDASSGFRAVRRAIIEKMRLHGTCTCGTFILEARSYGARVTEVPITVHERKDGIRRIKTKHLQQLFYVLFDLIRY
jgi:glycosyltransferase involved in cell wall biosynthesis